MTMDDKFLYDARRPPRRAFADQLRGRLEGGAPMAPRRSPLRRTPAWAALAAGVAIAAASFTLPSVRASAQAFLDLFRVRNFAAVSVDPARLDQLDNGHVDLEQLLGNHVETLQEPGPPRVVSNAAAAAAASGMAVATPGLLPRGLQPDTVLVRGEGAARVTVDTAKLRELLTSLAITDVTIPPGIDGSRVTLRMPPAVHMLYRNAKLQAMLVQARSPEVSLPQGIDLAQLGEIGLRIVGLSRAEAHRFAGSIDWHSTVLVPVPANATSFSQVSVRGNRGLLITTTGEPRPGRGHWHQGAVLLWSDGDKVYGLMGNIGTMDLTQMANSVQ
jgi:hypothetical protein